MAYHILVRRLGRLQQGTKLHIGAIPILASHYNPEANITSTENEIGVCLAGGRKETHLPRF